MSQREAVHNTRNASGGLKGEGSACRIQLTTSRELARRFDRWALDHAHGNRVDALAKLLDLAEKKR